MIDARAALRDGAPRVHAKRAGNVIVEGKMETPGFAAALDGARIGARDRNRARAGRTRRRSRRAPATPPAIRPGRVTLHLRDADAAR